MQGQFFTPSFGRGIHGGNDVFVDAGVEAKAQQDTDDLSDEEGPPDIVDIAGLCQQPCGRQQHEQLTADRNDQAEDAVAQRLKHRAEHDADARQQEMQADDTENYTEDCFYYFSEGTQTQVLTYDISDPEKPVKTGCVTQDGRYQTSRKIGNIIYLFTNKRISMPQQKKEEAVTEENVSGWIPLVNDKAVDAEDIYVDNGGGGSNSLLISSVNVKNPIRFWIIP